MLKISFKKWIHVTLHYFWCWLYLLEKWLKICQPLFACRRPVVRNKCTTVVKPIFWLAVGLRFIATEWIPPIILRHKIQPFKVTILRPCILVFSHKRLITKRETTKYSPYRCFILVQNLIILGHRDTENDRSNILEAMDPFLSFRPLAAYVKQSAIDNAFFILRLHQRGSVEVSSNHDRFNTSTDRTNIYNICSMGIEPIVLR